jgi:aspartate-semialdehyde dehydrogenase
VTEEEKKVLEETKKTIQEEGKKISESCSRIFMLGGPRFVQVILESQLHATKEMMKQLRLDTEIEFKGDPK